MPTLFFPYMNFNSFTREKHPDPYFIAYSISPRSNAFNQIYTKGYASFPTESMGFEWESSEASKVKNAPPIMDTKCW